MKQSAESMVTPFPVATAARDSSDPDIPDYLEKNYWWAYLHPRAVRIFEREWLVNLILWGNFRRLRDLAIAELGYPIEQQVLQVACVYGDFTQRIAAQIGQQGTLDVVDIAPIQLDNLRHKLAPDSTVRLHRQDSARLQFPTASVDAVVLFFLLHEQPEAVRRATLAEALRVVRPGGKVVIVDYHRPRRSNPLRYVMAPILKWLEPFATDLWRHEIADYLPEGAGGCSLGKETYFGGLYQKVVVRVGEGAETLVSAPDAASRF
ncbi:MAG: class SAM-dependent methyltransferase [Proteobacteria bacterium]|nr:class SAM-dependent methyltransferase [Pseudomonadota bacterium]